MTDDGDAPVSVEHEDGFISNRLRLPPVRPTVRPPRPPSGWSFGTTPVNGPYTHARGWRGGGEASERP